MKEPIQKLGALYINPAGGCNLNCSHCWVNQGDFSKDLLPLDSWKKLLLQGKELGCSYVKLTGGEPLLYEYFVPLYRFAAENIQRVSIETNGTLQPKGLWEVFSENRPFHVSVSIDSADSFTHDLFRGEPGSWAKTVSFAEKLVKAKIPNQAVMSIVDMQQNPIAKMIELVSDIGIDTLKINLVTPSGRGSSKNFFTSGDIFQMLSFFDWIASETPDWVLPTVPAALLPINRLSNLGYCPVRNLMGVLPDGTFALCGVAFSRKDMSWGRFPEMTVREAWINSPVYQRIRKLIPGRLEGVCKCCIHKQTCSGRCIVNNLETGGALTSPDFLCEKAYEAGLFPSTRLIGCNG